MTYGVVLQSSFQGFDDFTEALSGNYSCPTLKKRFCRMSGPSS
jgi:hypothetical protein